MTPPPRPARFDTLALGLLLAGTLVPATRGDDPTGPPPARTGRELMPTAIPPPPPDPAPMSLAPPAPAPIPDDPPPHEGAMIDYPLTIDPPDIITVEVIEALPGRPITGERLVRPDGTISLGFYGDVHVRGLSPGQAKVKVIHHLRRYLSDDVLGLVGHAEEPPRDGQEKPVLLPHPQRPSGTPPAAEPPATEPQPDRPAPEALRIAQVVQGAPIPARPAPPAARPDAEPDLFALRPRDPLPPGGVEIEPVLSTRVFVDFVAYNAKVYFVQGDVGSPGRLPFTGKETVLDALNYAGGLIPTAEPADIHLYRPARGGKPTRDYAIDLQAIWKGDARANLQVFPNDRLVVGRNAVVKKTIEIDRAAAPIHSMMSALLQYSVGTRTLGMAAGDVNGTTQATRDQVIRRWFDLLGNLPGGKADGLDPAKLFEVLPLKVEAKTDEKPAADPK